MKIINTLITILILSITAAQGQDHTMGISLMDKGEYADASTFFKNQIVEYPDDLTAKICYYRSIGLDGDIAESMKGFQNLSKELPGNEDILLNLAEAHLWSNQAEEAMTIYKKIKNQNSTSKKADLGIALANAKIENYTASKALLAKLYKENPTDLYIKDTYIAITKALAHQLKVKNNVTNAIAQLDSLIKDQLADRQVLIARAYYLLENKEVKLAQLAFRQLIVEDESAIDLRLALAYTYQLNFNFKKAYEYNLATYKLLELNTDKKIMESVLVANINTAILAKNSEVAKEMLDKLDSISTNNELKLNLKIQYLFSQREYPAISNLLEENKNQYNLDKHVLRLAIETKKKLNQELLNSITTSSKDSEISSLLSKLKANNLYELSTSYTLAKDNEASLMHTKLVSISGPKTSTFNWRIDARHYNATTINDEQVINHGLNTSLGKSYGGIDWNVGIGIAKSGLVGQSNTNFLGSMSASKKLSLNQLVRISINRTNLTLNPSVISQNVSSQEISLTHQLNQGKWHFYNQLSHSSNNNIGTSNRLFSDMAYHIKDLPILSIGIMTTILNSTSSSENAILPNSLKSYSTYLKWSNEYVPNTNWKYILQSGVGLQQINGGYHHITSFMTAQLHYQLENRFSLGIEAKVYNNDISGIYAYNFNSLGLNAKLFL